RRTICASWSSRAASPGTSLSISMSRPKMWCSCSPFGISAKQDSPPVNKDIGPAVRILRQGGLVAFPTETVYGLGADASNAAAVRRIFEVKGRPSTNPLICHVSDAEVATRYARAWPEAAEQLVGRVWRGPLTLGRPKRS